MKKKLSIVLVLLLVILTIFAGCKSETDPVDDAAAKETQTTTTQEKEKETDPATDEPEEVYTFTMTPYLGVPVDEDAAMVEYWEGVFNVDFEIIYLENTKIKELLPLRIASGDIPDIMTSLPFTQYYEFAEQGIVGTWTEEFLRENAPYIAEDLDSIGRSVWDFAVYNGEMFGIPFYNPQMATGEAIIWNTKWLDAVGMDIPETLEQAEAAFYAFTNNDPDGNGKDDTYGLSQDGMYMIYGAFGLPKHEWIEDGNGGLVYSYLQPEMKDVLTYLAKWYADGVIDPEFITGENKGGYFALSHAFCNGRIGFTGRGNEYHWWYPELGEKGVAIYANTELFYQNFPDGKYEFGPAIVGPTGKSNNGVVSLNIQSVISGAVAENEGKLKKYLEIAEKLGGFVDEEDYLTTRFGIEGTHWDRLETGAPKSREGFATTDELWGMGALTTFNIAIWGDGFAVMNPVDKAWRETEIFNDPKMVSVVPKIINIPLPSQGDYLTEVQKIIDEAVIEIIIGDKPVDYYDTVIEEAMAAGGEILTEEANEAYQN